MAISKTSKRIANMAEGDEEERYEFQCLRYGRWVKVKASTDYNWLYSEMVYYVEGRLSLLRIVKVTVRVMEEREQ
jgi:hypothetical protein